MYVSALIHSIEAGEHSRQELAKARRTAAQLTAVSFVSGEAWDKWLNENREYLVWSDSVGRFVVDAEAKNASVPTLDYRTKHPWVKRP